MLVFPNHTYSTNLYRAATDNGLGERNQRPHDKALQIKPTGERYLNNKSFVQLLEQIETPGLGTKIVVDPSKETDQFWFPAQFKGKKLVPGITAIKNKKPSNDSEIQAISGATISSKAVVDILNKEMTKARKLYRER